MPDHVAPGSYDRRRNAHATGKANANYVRRKLPVRKVDASSVPEVFNADAISGNGRVWAGFDGERVVCVAANADECRRSYRAWEHREHETKWINGYGRSQREIPQKS